jgi:hypothetical protein
MIGEKDYEPEWHPRDGTMNQGGQEQLDHHRM